jgi:adenine-specific DNA-methyltransferase
MFEPVAGPIRILDAGAGAGSLTACLLARILAERWPVTVEAHAVEVDERFAPALRDTLRECEDAAPGATSFLHAVDFLGWASDQLGLGLFAGEPQPFDLAILNPPYRKLHTASRERQLASAVGIETSNLYSAFVALSLRLLAPGGQLVAITPRSFCNGPYFKTFRELILREAALARIHLFDSRDQAFRDTAVLQENVIIHLVKGGVQDRVVVSSSDGSGGDAITSHSVPFEDVVHPDDTNRFIHVVLDPGQTDVAARIARLPSTLLNLPAAVSTGKVVDFRARQHLRMKSEPGTVPLLYPMHLRDGRVRWPGTSSKKPCALLSNSTTAGLLLPRGHYVLVKRFSAKEERRRVVASVLEADDLDTPLVAIENHVNVFHRGGSGLDLNVAWGLATYLNSTILDQFFRQFNGHTQVNATDLRSIRYPTGGELFTLGAAARTAGRDQATIDSLLGHHVPVVVDA